MTEAPAIAASILNALRESFVGREEHVCRVLCGCAAEHWLNAEAAAHANAQAETVLGARSHWIVTEKNKCDLPVYKIELTAEAAIRATVEAKVVYPWSEYDVDSKLRGLLKQLNQLRDSGFDAYGICYRVWTPFWSDDLIAGREWRMRDLEVFRSLTDRILRALFPADGFAPGEWSPLLESQATVAGRAASVYMDAAIIRTERLQNAQ